MKIQSASIAFLFVLIYINPFQSQAQPSAEQNNTVVNIMAEDYSFQAPDKISTGWTTIQYENQGEEPHFLFMAKLPEGKTLDDYASSIVAPFNEVWYALRDEGLDQESAYEQLGANLPEWFAGVEFMGGTGIIPAGAVSNVTLNLEPGTYILECYMKTEEGEMHNMEGMLRELTVTDTPSEATAPEADIDITLSNFEMAIDGNLSPGTHTVSVHVAEQPEEGFGHNVHVAKVDADADVNEVMRWMNFMEVDGLRTPSPYSFAGGIHIMPEGETGYFSLDLEPGRYLFISEYTAHLGVLQDITVE